MRDRDVSSLELTDHYLARIDKLSDTVGAFITVTADLAREQARALDIEVRRGELRSPLHGVPVPVARPRFPYSRAGRTPVCSSCPA